MYPSLPHSLIALNLLICLTLSSPSPNPLPRDLLPEATTLPPLTARSPSLTRGFLDFVARGIVIPSGAAARAGAGGVGHTIPATPQHPGSNTPHRETPDIETPDIPDVNTDTDTDTADTGSTTNSAANFGSAFNVSTTDASSATLPTGAAGRLGGGGGKRWGVAGAALVGVGVGMGML